MIGKAQRIIAYCVLMCALVIGVALFMTSPVAADAPLIHVVNWGDTLFSIASRYGTSVNAFVQVNNLRNPEFIYVGQRLIVPGNAIPPPVTIAPASYLVQSGDTLFSIATRYGTSVGALMRANGLYNYWIYVGQTLRIPGAPTQPLPPPVQQGPYYIVQAGDYLASIAARYRSNLIAIQIANKLPSPAFIWTGQQLFIPGGEPPINPPQPAPQPGGQLPGNPPFPFPVYPNVPPYVPPVAPPAGGQVVYPAPVVNPNASLWDAVVISSTLDAGSCSLMAFVIGKENWPVVLATLDGSTVTDAKYTGTKPERGPYAVEFAHSCTGTWRVIPLGLNTYADVTMQNGHIEIEFRPRS